MLINRRDFVLSTAMAGLATTVSWRALAAINPELSKAFDAITNDILDQQPETRTYLGIDTGAHSAARGKLDDYSLAGREEVPPKIAKYRALLRQSGRKSLPNSDKYLYDAVNYKLASGTAGVAFSYGRIGTFGGGNPYIISQQGGAYSDVPDFLDSIHPVENKADAEAYLSRLSAFATALDHQTEWVKRDADMGVIPPDFILDTVLGQMKGLRSKPAGEVKLVISLARRAKEKQIEGNWAERATRIVEASIYPALDRQIAVVTANRAKATHDGGIWKLPQGDAYYKWRLESHTTTNLSAEEIHTMGLEQGRDLDARMDKVLRSQGMTQGTVGERIAALGKDPRQAYPNTDAGKQEAIEYINSKVAELRQLMSKLSHMKLKADMVVKRVPPEIEAGAPLGYAEGAARDGSRPAAYYINLENSANWPKYTLPTLSAHEGLPGHVWDGAYANEHQDDVPLICSLIGFGAFGEGWGLYSEQLVDEYGFYKDDPMGQLGMYQMQRLRASRLVADTGLHAKRWSREQAIDYMVASTGWSLGACTSEVHRYCAGPGQACSYKVGHTEIVRLREKAKAALGARFDVRDFNDAVIQTTGVPLAVLATAIDDYIARVKG